MRSVCHTPGWLLQTACTSDTRRWSHVTRLCLSSLLQTDHELGAKGRDHEEGLTLCTGRQWPTWPDEVASSMLRRLEEQAPSASSTCLVRASLAAALVASKLSKEAKSNPAAVTRSVRLGQHSEVTASAILQGSSAPLDILPAALHSLVKA